MAFELPKLPYAFDALEPHLTKKLTMTDIITRMLRN